MTSEFSIHRPHFDAATGVASFSYGLDGKHFVETLEFPGGADSSAAGSAAFRKLLDLTAMVLGVSYFKLTAPLVIAAPDLPLTPAERDFVIDLYENGLGEFYARNALHRFGRLVLRAIDDTGTPPSPLPLRARALLPVGGGKDSLVSLQLLAAAGVEFTPFAVNPKGPILTSIERSGRAPIFVTRTLDREMIRLSGTPGYFSGHVPSTAINSMVAALTSVLFGYNSIVLSNERSASEGNARHDGREVNHQYSKSLDFERKLSEVLAGTTGGALHYYSLLRPYSEARIAQLFARNTFYDNVFSSCNRNFRYDGHNGPLWCGACPKCHFVFLILAPFMEKQRLINIFGGNLLARPENEGSFRELTGLAGQKPWECVGEILEAAACLMALARRPEWSEDAIVATLKPDLLTQYGSQALEAALAELMSDSPEHLIPNDLAKRVAQHALR